MAAKTHRGNTGNASPAACPATSLIWDRHKRIKLTSGWACMAGERAVLSEVSYKDALERAAQLVAEAL